MATEFKTPVSASVALAQDDAALQALQIAGWDLDYITNTNGTKEFGVLHRSSNWGFGTPQPLKSGITLTGSANKSPSQTTGSNPPMGSPQIGLTPPVPSDALAVSGSSGLALLDVLSLPTLARIRRNKTRLVFAVDTEFYYPGGENSREREILTWQFSFAEPCNEDMVHNLIFFSCNGKRLGLGRAISYCLCRFNAVEQLRELRSTKCDVNGYRFEYTREWVVPKYDTKGALWNDYRFGDHNPNWQAFKTFEDARAACCDPDFKTAYDQLAASRKHPTRVKLHSGALAGYSNNFSSFHKNAIHLPITVLCHAGKADLSAFGLGDAEKDVMRCVSEVQGGLISMQNFTMNPARADDSYWRFYPLSIEVRDTMCFAAAGHKSLDKLGEAVGFKKLELLPGYNKDHMENYLLCQPMDFAEYASRDAEVTLRYAGVLFGFNKSMPATASSAAVNSIVETIKDAWCLKNNTEFDEVWRGLTHEPVGMLTDPITGKLVQAYKRNQPVSDEARIIQEYARNSYKGGANGCSSVGWIDGLTHDLDKCSAYPTAMSCVFDIDWQADKLITREWVRENALLEDFHTPFDPAWAYVDDFEFPDSVLYPCIAVNIDGCIVFPRTLGARDGVYLAGVEIFTALKLGARVHIQHGYKAKFLVDAHGQPTRSLFMGVREFVNDRATIKKAVKNGQEGLVVFEQLEKTMASSSYGKTAQNVVEKHTWDSRTQDMVDLGMSRITSPTHASMTTAIVRCVLMAAMNELSELGYDSHSFTTDGFITTADADIVNKLDLCGLAPYLRQVRVELSGIDTIWEEKHSQNGFYNITTRGNIAPNEGGVCAHNSFVSPYPSKSIDDRLYCLDVFLRRKLKVDCTVGVWAKFKDMADSVLREDFYVEKKSRSLSMDFDLKRKPVKGSLHTVHPVINGETFEVANLLTVPYDSPEDYEFYKARGKASACLRTEEEWRRFFARVESAASGVQRHVKDFEWSCIFTCVMGHRLGVWHIPTLDDERMSVEDKCQWINKFNESSVVFKPSHWKNARRQERQTQMLHRTEVEDLLNAMGAVIT